MATRVVYYAAPDDRIVVSHDTDFGALLAFRWSARPSFILFRSSDPITRNEQAALIVSKLDTFADELEGWCNRCLRPRPPPCPSSSCLLIDETLSRV